MCHLRFLQLELYDTGRVGSSVNYPFPQGSLPPGRWQQGGLLVSSTPPGPHGSVPSPLQFNVTPADVETDIAGALGGAQTRQGKPMCCSHLHPPPDACHPLTRPAVCVPLPPGGPRPPAMQRDGPGRHAPLRVVPLPSLLCLSCQHGAVHPPVRCPLQRNGSCAAAAVDGRGGVEHGQLWAWG